MYSTDSTEYKCVPIGTYNYFSHLNILFINIFFFNCRGLALRGVFNLLDLCVCVRRAYDINSSGYFSCTIVQLWTKSIVSCLNKLFPCKLSRVS